MGSRIKTIFRQEQFSCLTAATLVQVTKLKIGALSVTPDSHPVLYNRLQAFGSVRTLGPDDYDMRLDIIILPDGMGISPNLQCFSIGGSDMLPTAPISPSVERFRNRHLENYIESPLFIIGIGDNAALLWNHFGYKVGVSSKQLNLLAPTPEQILEVEVLGRQDSIIEGFRIGNVIGISHERDLTNILVTLRREIEQEMKDDTERIITAVENQPNQPKPSLKGESNMPKEEDNNNETFFVDSV